jgi:hypothetical protein
MKLQISVGRARKRFDAMCQERNDAMPVKAVTRITQKGEQTYERKTKAISDGAQTTGKALILSYANYYRVKIESMPEGWFSDGMPSLLTNSERIAGFRQNVCARTIRNHIRELKEIGLIVDYKFHGSSRDFEVWIDATVIFGAENVSLSGGMPEFSPAENTGIVPFSGADSSAQQINSTSLNGTNFPHKQSLETEGYNKTTIRKVEKFDLSGTQSNGNTASKPQSMTVCHGNVGGLGRGGSKKSPINVDNPAETVDKSVDKWKSPEAGKDFDRLHRFYQNSIMEFWKYATKSLWAERTFTNYEFLRSADLILDAIYRPFLKDKHNLEQFNEFQNELMRAVDVARKHYERHPNQYPGDPYSLTDFPTGYFDKNNPRGFVVPMAWRFKNKAAEHDNYGKRMVKTAIMHVKNHGEGKAPKALQQKTLSQVVDFYTTKLKRYDVDTQQDFLRRLNSVILTRK